MMKVRTAARLVFLFLVLHTTQSPLFAQTTPRGLRPLRQTQTLDTTRLLQTIALGSCNRQDQPQIMWKYIVQNAPDLWIWLGDNIYGDSEDMTVLANKYRQIKYAPEYEAFRRLVPVIGTWDDHDYGVNDGGREYAKKDESKALMLDFLDVPAEAPVRRRPGVYQSYSFGPAGRRVKVILLDTRSFRDPLERNADKAYLPNATGSVLGEAQWRWLEHELRDRQVQLFLIASGYQILPEEHRFEKWANFPGERRRLLQLLARTRPPRVVLLSGDRHFAELSRTNIDGLPYPLYELTASGMTHSSEKINEANRYRVGDPVGAKNFGVLRIDWSGSTPRLLVEVRGLENTAFLTRKLE